MPSTLTVSKLSDLTFAVSNDGVITISAPGQTDITCSCNSYTKWYTWGVVGSGTNPFTFAVSPCSAPSGLKSESYTNNGNLSLGVTTNGASKIVQGNHGDSRIGGGMVAISVLIDNQSLNGSSGSYPNYLVAHMPSGGAYLTFYHP
ncbi:MAG: hypothetical protein JST76_09420 [Bacteroidetes bacterium]|nr:hypothetical protein [Bacteroidota bacterium]